MQHKSIDNDEDDHEIEHSDDTTNPSFSYATSDWEQIKFSKNE